MDPFIYFVAVALSLFLMHSMKYNSRRLEAIGYAFSVLFLQQLIAGHEDIFLICPQFPVYVSPKDNEQGPNVTMPDSGARGVYVDHVLLLPRASQTAGDRSLLETFRANSLRNLNPLQSLQITSLEVPLLEERKRAPTRHPRDLGAYVASIQSALAAAASQVCTQARILFSSPRFVTQDVVILMASSGEYYRLAVLARGHGALSTVPPSIVVLSLLDDGPPIDEEEVTADLRFQMVVSPRSSRERKQQQELADQRTEEAEKRKQNDARDSRALARSQRQAMLSNEEKTESQVIANAGPGPLYSDFWIEAYHDICIDEDVESYQRYPTFFEPVPKPHETLSTFANIRNPNDSRDIIFTGVIRMGSPVSDKFLEMLRKYLSSLAAKERNRRQSTG